MGIEGRLCRVLGLRYGEDWHWYDRKEGRFVLHEELPSRCSRIANALRDRWAIVCHDCGIGRGVWSYAETPSRLGAPSYAEDHYRFEEQRCRR